MDNFWHDLLPYELGNSTWENKSIDVVIRGCFDYYNTTACVRNSLLTLLGFSTLFLCVFRIARLHILHHPQIHQFIIFYCASFEIVFLIIKWLAINNLYQMEFVASYLKMIQFILLCHFHWSLVSRILHQQKLINWIIVPLLAGFLFLFSFITSFGLLSHFSSWEECLAPHWLLLSCVEFLGIQLYMLAGVYITKKINSVSALDSFKREQKRDLWSVIATYEFSSTVSLCYFISLRILGNKEIGCSGIFGHIQEVYSPVFATLMLIKYLMPIWVMLFVFYPTRGIMSSEEERLLGWSIEGSTTSVFSQDSRFMESYRQLILPVQNRLSDYPGLRRSFSSPALLAKADLSPVFEEDAHLSPSLVVGIGYGTLEPTNSQPALSRLVQSRARCRHDSGLPRNVSKNKVLVSVNQCSGEMENVSPPFNERA